MVKINVLVKLELNYSQNYKFIQKIEKWNLMVYSWGRWFRILGIKVSQESFQSDRKRDEHVEN